jgi:hypothetical protein
MYFYRKGRCLAPATTNRRLISLRPNYFCFPRVILTIESTFIAFPFLYSVFCAVSAFAFFGSSRPLQDLLQRSYQFLSSQPYF